MTTENGSGSARAELGPWGMAGVWAFALLVIVGGAVGIWGYVTGRDEVLVIAGALVVGGAGIAGLRQDVKHWRGESYTSRQVLAPNWWRWSPGLWRANRRSSVAMAVSAVPGLGLLLLVIAVLQLDWPAPAEQLWWAPLLVLATVGFWVADAILMAAIVLFNRPVWAVPPHLRSLPGLLADDRHDPEVGAELHRTPRELGLKGNYPQDPDR